MIFPLEQLVKFKGNVYAATCAAAKRAYQLARMEDPILIDNDDKAVSVAARQIFTNDVQYKIAKAE